MLPKNKTGRSSFFNTGPRLKKSAYDDILTPKQKTVTDRQGDTADLNLKES